MAARPVLYLRPCLLRLGALCAVMFGASIHSMASAYEPASKMVAEPSSTQESASGVTTFCLGRFLIDVPAGSKVSGGNYQYDFIAIKPVEPSGVDEFDKAISKQEEELSAATHEETRQSMLLHASRPAQDSIILAFWQMNFSTAAITIEGYRWVNGVKFRLQDTVGRTKQELGISAMRDALSRVRPRAETDIPSDPGYCFASGFIANPKWRNEEATIDIDIAGHPDAYVTLTIYPLASYRKDKPLLERMGGLAQALANMAASVRVLRKGERRVGPYQGQEHLASIPDSTGARGHSFVWETQGEGTLDTPAIKIELTTGHPDSNGKPQRTTLTDREAIKLWDEIVRSLRPRPIASQTTAAAP